MVKYKRGVDEYTASLDDLINIVNIDLNFSFQCCSAEVVRQVHGCPIGGFLSSIYANIKCARDEFNFMKTLGPKRSLIYAIRQVDDLIFWAAFDKRSRQSKNFAKNCLKSIITYNKVYTGGLELEEQKFQALDNFRTIHKFAGTLITVTQGLGEGVRFDCQPHCKNEDSLVKNGKQFYPRFVSAASMVPDHFKKGQQITSLLRMYYQCTNYESLVNAMILNYAEMASIGYSFRFYVNALFYVVANKDGWADIAVSFFNKIYLLDIGASNKKLCINSLKYLQHLIST